ncbi:MAG TPA: Ig-like domain-containing protein, partial [Gemmataceae bacterium]
PTQGTLTLNSDGSFQYVPNSNTNGTDKFTYAWKNTITGATGTALVTITVDPVNDPPTVAPSPLPTVTVNEDAGTQSIAGFATTGPGGGPDEASQTLTTTISNDNNALFIGQPTIDATGRLTFTPAPNANGSATITFTVKDSGGTFTNPLDNDTTVATFQIVVNPVNDQPSIQVQAAPPTVLEDAGPQVVTGPGATPFVTFQPAPPSAVDEQSQTPTYIFTPIGNLAPQSPTGKLEFSAGPAIDANGNLTYTPAPNSNGTATFILQANDGGGTANGGVDLSAARTFVITVTPVNDPPTVNNISTGVLWNSGPNVLNAIALGGDSGAPDVGETVTVVAASQPANGTVVIQPGATSVTYQPNPTFVGTDSFTYTLGDGHGGVASATITVDVHRSNTQAVNLVAIGSGVGGNAEVRIYDSKTGQFMNGFAAFDPAFEGGISVATGDVNGDGVPDIIVGAGAGGGPRVEVIDGTKLGLLQGVNQIANPAATLINMFVYDWNFHGGVTVAAGDVNGDGKADIIVGTGAGGGPNVKVINGAMLGDLGPDGLPAPAAIIASFFAYDPIFRGGVNVASADVDGDGFADVLTAPGSGGGSQIKVYSGHTLFQSGADAPGILIASFYGFDPAFLGGVNIAAGDLDGDGLADIILGAGPGGGPNVKVFSPLNLATPVASFFAFDPSFNSGVFVGYRTRDGGASPLLLAGSGHGDSASLVAFAPPDYQPVQNIDAFDSDFIGGVTVG